MYDFSLTRHARNRAQQRGVPYALIEAVLSHADRNTPVGGNCTAFLVSKARLKDRKVRQTLGADADRLCGLFVVCADETGEVVTILHNAGGAKGRHYRRAN